MHDHLKLCKMHRRDYILITKNCHRKSITKQIFNGNYNRIDFACKENPVYWHQNIAKFYEYSSEYSNSLETRSCKRRAVHKIYTVFVNDVNVHLSTCKRNYKYMGEAKTTQNTQTY